MTPAPSRRATSPESTVHPDPGLDNIVHQHNDRPCRIRLADRSALDPDQPMTRRESVAAAGTQLGVRPPQSSASTAPGPGQKAGWADHDSAAPSAGGLPPCSEPLFVFVYPGRAVTVTCASEQVADLEPVPDLEPVRIVIEPGISVLLVGHQPGQGAATPGPA